MGYKMAGGGGDNKSKLTIKSQLYAPTLTVTIGRNGVVFQQKLTAKKLNKVSTVANHGGNHHSRRK